MEIEKDSFVRGRPFLDHIHLFRAFAIFSIMMAHLWSSADFGTQLAIARHCSNVFFGNSTIYFIFISGFLFQYLSSNFQIKQYYGKKIKFVILPYLIISLAITMATLFKGYFFEQQNFPLIEFLKIYFINIINGKAAYQFWYIPFIVIVFFISPCLLRIPERYDKIVILISAVLPLLGTRTGIEITFYQFLYFFPIYILGFYTSKYYFFIVERVEKYYKILLWIFIIATAILVPLYLHDTKYGVFSIREMIFYIQKISLTFFLIVKLKGIKSNRFFNMLANYSFALYFLHTFIPLYTEWSILQYIDSHLANFGFILSFILALVYIFITVFIIWAIKKILKANSRYIIGA